VPRTWDSVIFSRDYRVKELTYFPARGLGTKELPAVIVYLEIER